jgi:L-amino acid N-acyltransferase YncA
VPRRDYQLSLRAFRGQRIGVPKGFSLRHPELTDSQSLAVLVLEGYRGTIDDEGETLDDARQFVAASFSEEPLLDASWLVLDGQRLAAALFVRRWQARPLVTFVVTHPAYRGRRLAALILERAIFSLLGSGETHLLAAISEGNLASERLFSGFGFSRSTA